MLLRVRYLWKKKKNKTVCQYRDTTISRFDQPKPASGFFPSLIIMYIFAKCKFRITGFPRVFTSRRLSNGWSRSNRKPLSSVKARRQATIHLCRNTIFLRITGYQPATYEASSVLGTLAAKSHPIFRHARRVRRYIDVHRNYKPITPDAILVSKHVSNASVRDDVCDMCVIRANTHMCCANNASHVIGRQMSINSSKISSQGPGLFLVRLSRAKIERCVVPHECLINFHACFCK